MKVDQLIKRLESIKIDENKIDERREIAEYLAHTFGDKMIRITYHFMTKDKTIYDFFSYKKLLESNEISPDNVLVYVEKDYFPGTDTAGYFYPFLGNRYLLEDAYLSKLGLKGSFSYVVPATGLKYVSRVTRYLDINRVVVEVADIDIVATNLNLPRLIYSDVKNKYIIDDEVDKIISQLHSQKLFAGYNFDEAREIINRYYEDHDESLAKDVDAIIHAYNQIFQPYRIEYDLKSKRIIASFVRKPF
jgi:hypothetical protein